MKKLLLWALLFVPFTSAAQSTTALSSGVVDSDGFTWVGGTDQITFVPTLSWPKIAAYVWTDATLQRVFTDSLNRSGAFSPSISGNAPFSPVGSQWKSTNFPNATSGCFSVNASISRTPKDFASILNSFANGPRFSANPAVFEYGLVEVPPTPQSGAFFCSNTTGSCRQYGTSGWGGCAWGATGCGTGGPYTITLGGTNAAIVSAERQDLGVPQVSVLDYGAVSDALSVTDGAMSSGSPVLTSDSGLFTSSSCGLGKMISVQGAGGTSGSQQPLVTTCTYNSATRVTLAASAQQTVTNAGVIWGSDNYSAFSSWIAALAGKHGLIPQGNYLVNLQQSTLTLSVPSNTNITMDRGGTLYYVGNKFASGAGALFSIPANTTNVTFDGMHIVGEFLNTRSLAGVGQGTAQGTAFKWTSVSGSSSHIQIHHSIVTNLFGEGAYDANNADTDIDISYNTFSKNADESINVNSNSSNISDNYITGPSACVELAGAQSDYKNNTCVDPGGTYGMSFGGNTSGTPYVGTEVSGNIVQNPRGSGCFVFTDGFTEGTIANNTCLGLSTSGQFGFVNAYTGYSVTGNNSFIGNGVTGSTGFATAFYENQANNDTYRDNWTDSTVNGISIQSSTGINSTQNVWNYLHLNGKSSGRFQDYLISGVYTLCASTCTFSDNTVLDGPSGLVYSGSPASAFSSTVQNPAFFMASNAILRNSTTSLNSASGPGGGYSVTMHHTCGLTNSVIDFGYVNANLTTPSNESHTWASAECDAVYSSIFGVFTAEVRFPIYNTYQAIHVLSLFINYGVTHACGAINRSLRVGAIGSCSDPGTASTKYLAQPAGPAPVSSYPSKPMEWELELGGSLHWSGTPAIATGRYGCRQLVPLSKSHH